MDEEQQNEAPPRRRGMNWLGLVAFIVITFGQRIVGFARWLFAGGTALLPGSFDPALVLGGGALVALVVATAVTLRARRSGDTRGPTLPPAPRANAPMPPFGGPDMPTFSADHAPTTAPPPNPAQSLPTAPRFEPIISARVALMIGLLALLAGGAIVMLLFVNF